MIGKTELLGKREFLGSSNRNLEAELFYKLCLKTKSIFQTWRQGDRFRGMCQIIFTKTYKFRGFSGVFSDGRPGLCGAHHEYRRADPYE
jgi:hypothetical protein